MSERIVADGLTMEITLIFFLFVCCRYYDSTYMTYGVSM
uniref:Uncharacterized protein n=1 Tax=Arundo donax TaxID=35708 RepID=A0A0A9GXD6_ARUDO